MLAAVPAHAQATRTWVSGVGDDVNPCSRTAPCKTFAGAISKTATAGEINCLDPGGFGTVTITKSMTLNCHEVLGSILASGVPGITINAAGGTVILRNLQINGVTGGTAVSGTIGVRIISAASVSIEDSVITQFAQKGVSDERTTGGTKLFVRNSVVSFNGSTGLSFTASGTGGGTAEIEGTASNNNLYGVAVGPGNNVAVKRSVFSGNTSIGIEADAGGQLTVDDSVISNNVTGVAAYGNIRLSNTDINFNGTAVSGAATTYGNNRLFGNVSSGVSMTPASPGQQ